jgi:uncharacterized protein (TIGR03067 family)
MIRRAWLCPILGVLMATVSAAFAPAPVYREPAKPKGPDVYALMQGTWEIDPKANIAPLVRPGMAMRRMPQQIRIQGTTWEYMASDNSLFKTSSAKNRIVLDPKASPPTLDLIQLGFMVEYPTMKGIVKVEGDTLTFCYVSAQEKDAERPKRFVVGNPFQPIQPKDPRMMTLTRVK